MVEYSYQAQLEAFKKIMEEKGSLKSKMTRFLKEVYLSEKSINNYFSPEDFHAILQKLPPTYTEREERMTSEVLETAMTYIDLQSSMGGFSDVTGLFDLHCDKELCRNCQKSERRDFGYINTFYS